MQKNANGAHSISTVKKLQRNIIGARLDIHHKCSSAEERNHLIEIYLKKVGLSPEQGDRYPAQFSGGQRQRVGIATAESCHAVVFGILAMIPVTINVAGKTYHEGLKNSDELRIGVLSSPDEGKQ